MDAASLRLCFGGVAALAIGNASARMATRTNTGFVVSAGAVAAVAAYTKLRADLIAAGRLDVDHLVGAADGVGEYQGGCVCDIDTITVAELTEEEATLLASEHLVADWFTPFRRDALGARQRSLLRYWVDRLRMEVKIVGTTHADACVMRHILQKMMRAKHYRTHQIAAMADTIVGLLQAGTQLDGVSAAVVEATHRRTWTEWLLRLPPPIVRRR